MSDGDRGHDFKFLLGFFIGGLLGALTIFFLGTKEGKRAGKLLEEKGKDALDDLQEKVNELEKKGKDLARHGEELRDQLLDRIEDKKEDLTEKTAQRLDTALANVEKIQEQGVEVTANLRRRLFKNIPKKSS